MWGFLILIILFLIFIPIPIKFKIIGENLNIKIYLYNKLIFSYEDFKKKIKPKNTLSKKKYKTNTKKSNKILNPKKFIKILFENSFKPDLKLSLYLKYSLENSAHTAIVFGILNEVFAIIHVAVNGIFNIKYWDFNVSPEFKDEIEFFIYIKGIMYINIVKLIYILLLYLYKK